MQAPVPRSDLAREVRGDAGPVDDLTCAPAAPGEIGHVGRVQAVERLMEPLPSTSLLEHVAVRLGGRCEAVRHLYTLGVELAVHLAERSVLPSDERNVIDPELLEELYELGGGHDA